MKALRRWLFHPVLTALSLLAFVVLLTRLPSLTEPYWYGDEGIYLTIGQALNHGAVLYKDIVDHKTPLMYYFARVGTQSSLRLLLTGWMMAAAGAFFGILLRLTKRVWFAFGWTLGFAIATSLPLLEGNIANGELFVMGFVLVSFWVFLQTKAGLALLTQPLAAGTPLPSPSRHERWWWLLAGVLLGGAILTKVPALFDVAALFLIGWLAAGDLQRHAGKRRLVRVWQTLAKQWGLLLSGLSLSLLTSIVYFWSQGAVKEYLAFGLLYNLHYVQTWNLNHLPVIARLLLTLPAKLLLLSLLLGGLTAAGQWLARPTRWAAGWFLLALVGCTLSNRPYPHYFLQLLPPALLLGSLVWSEVRAAAPAKAYPRHRLAPLATLALAGCFVWLVWNALGVGSYPVVSYYQRFFALLTGRITTSAYRNSFNAYLADDYAAASVLRASEDRHLFIWGTNPMLYALSKKQPVGRFTVAFHIQDLGLYQETIDAVAKTSPQYIVVMKDEPASLPGLKELVTTNYRLTQNFEHFTVWQKQSAPTPQPAH